jgi:hypothetical protein
MPLAVSVQQPYADLIVAGAKPVENRTWKTQHRGELWIHASRWESKASREDWQADPNYPGDGLVQAVVGRVAVVDVVAVEAVSAAFRISHFQKRFASRPEARRSQEELAATLSDRVRRLVEGWTDEQWRHASGPWCWILTDPVRLEKPLPMAGKLMTWSFDLPDRPLAAPNSPQHADDSQ